MIKALFSFSALLLLLLQGASAQESIALAVDGWRTETRNDIVY